MYFYQQADAWQASTWQQYQEYSAGSWQQAPAVAQAWQYQQYQPQPAAAVNTFINMDDYSDASDSDDEQLRKAPAPPAKKLQGSEEEANTSKCVEEPSSTLVVPAATSAEPAAEPAPLHAADPCRDEAAADADAPAVAPATPPSDLASQCVSSACSEPDAEMEASGAKEAVEQKEEDKEDAEEKEEAEGNEDREEDKAEGMQGDGIARRKTTIDSDSALSFSSAGSALGEDEEVEGEEDPAQQCCLRIGSVRDMLLWRFAAADVPALADLPRAEAVNEQQPKQQPQQLQQQAQRRAQDQAPVQASKSEGAATTQWGRGERRRDAAPSAQRLRPSATSWVACQRSSEDAGEDAKVLRSIKAVLNKLTIEKFAPLYQQLITSGITTTGHVEYLIQEIFEKATTQHHFIDMYAEMCALLHEHFVANPVGEEAKSGFKRLLLTQCQTSFERYLLPPVEISKIQDADERRLAETRYKMQMLGNIKFVGALLTRKMLASKVMFAICEELLNDPTPEALESVAALLTVVGPTFDRPEWQGRVALTAIFHRLRALVQKPGCDARSRCLIKDVLDLRANGYDDCRPKRQEGPTTLKEVARRASADGAGAADHPKLAAAGRPRAFSAAAAVAARTAAQQQPAPPKAAAPPRAAQAAPQRPAAAASSARIADPAKPPSFDREAFRAEVQRMLRELRLSSDEAGAAARLSEQPAPPAKEQAEEVRNLLAEVTQEADASARKAGFRVALGLVARWRAGALADGLREFVEQDCEDLRLDVPSLPGILRGELAPALGPLSAKGLVPATALEALRAAAA